MGRVGDGELGLDEDGGLEWVRMCSVAGPSRTWMGDGGVAVGQGEPGWARVGQGGWWTSGVSGLGWAVYQKCWWVREGHGG